MKKYIWIVFCFFVLLYFGPSLIAPVTQAECVEAVSASEMFSRGNFSIKYLDRYLAGAFLHLFGNNPLGLRFGNILVVALMSFCGMFAIRKCTNDTMIGIMSTLIYFTSFWCFYSPVVPRNMVWGEFFNVLALGVFFMASRENRFSMQRILLLLLCGFLTALSLLINGISPFIMAFCIAVIFLLVERKYLDMLLMPLLISVITIGFLLIHGKYVSGGWFFELHGLWCDFIKGADSLFSRETPDNLLRNLKMLFIGILPSLVFLICAIQGYRKYYTQFFSRSIYRFTLIFLCVGVVSVLLNRGSFLADLPLTYLPYSFLVGAGFVHYLRTRNHYLLFRSMLALFAIGMLAVACYDLFKHDMDINRNFAVAGMVWSIFILFSFTGGRVRNRLTAYFLGLTVGLLTVITATRQNEITEMEIRAHLAKVVDPAEDDFTIIAAGNMYYVVRFYLDEYQVVKAEDSCMKQCKMKKDAVLFAFDEEVPEDRLSQARTIKFDKFNIHLFKVAE